MIITDKQAAILEPASRHPEGLVIPPTALPPGPRAAMARGMIRAGLATSTSGADGKALAAAWKLDGVAQLLRITEAGTRALEDEPSSVAGSAAEPDIGPLMGFGAPEHVVAAELPATALMGLPVELGGQDATGQDAERMQHRSQTPDTSKPAPVQQPAAKRRGSAGTLRDAAAAVLVAWDDDAAERRNLPDAMDRLRAMLVKPKPAPAQELADGRLRKMRVGTRQQQILELLQRADGATVAQIAGATGWANHTVRGFFAGLRKRGIVVEVLERVRQIGPGRGGAKGSYTIYRLAEAA